MIWRLLLVLALVIALLIPVVARGQEDAEPDTIDEQTLPAEPTPIVIVVTATPEPNAIPRARPDTAVVLFDYQAVNDPLTKFEGTMTRVLPGVTGTLFVTVDSRFPGRVNDLWVDERNLWRETVVPDPPRGLAEFHSSQVLLRQAQQILTSTFTEFAVGTIAEVALRNFPDEQKYLDQVRSSRQGIRDKVVQANDLLRQSRQSLEDARAALLAP